MDGSIAASASVRMRDQLRGAFHAPTAGADAGLFEELLRMPIAQSRPERDDAPPAPDDAAAQAAAQKAGEKSIKEASHKDDDDVDDDAVDDARAESADTSISPQMIPAQPSPVQSPPPHDEKVAATAIDTKVRASATTPKDANKNGKPIDVAQTAPAAAERPAQTVESAVASAAPATDAQPVTQVAEAPPEEQTAPAAEPTASLDGEQAVPVAGSLGGDAADSDQTPPQSAQAKPSAKVDTKAPSVPVAAPVQAQSQSDSPHARAKSQLQLQAQSQANTPTPAQATAPQSDQPADKKTARADAGERGEKWYLKDDDGAQNEEAAAAGANANQDKPRVDPLPVVSAVDVPSVQPGNDASSSLSDVVPTDATQTAAAQASPTIDAAAMASALVQQNSGSSSPGTTRSDSHMTSPGVGHAGGARTTAASNAHVDGAPDRDKGGVAGLSQQERVRLVQRVARSFSRLGPDGGQVTLKLHPPQLGVLSMSVRIEGQSMTARLHTETTGARDAILENLPVLRDRLAEQGIEVESFHVEVASDRNATADNQSQSQAQNPFSGDSSGESRSGPRSVDYRRLSRSSSELPSMAAGLTRGPDQSRWSAHSPLERSLDVRA